MGHLDHPHFIWRLFDYVDCDGRCQQGQSFNNKWIADNNHEFWHCFQLSSWRHHDNGYGKPANFRTFQHHL
jgi:hypothetical protein